MPNSGAMLRNELEGRLFPENGEKNLPPSNSSVDSSAEVAKPAALTDPDIVRHTTASFYALPLSFRTSVFSKNAPSSVMTVGPHSS